MRKTYIYSDPLNDDFAGNNIKRRPLPENYRYERNGHVWHFLRFTVYRLVAKPIVFIVLKTVWRQRFENKKVLRSAGGGYYVYANHTGGVLDAFCPNSAGRKSNSIVVGPDAMSIKGLNSILYLLGAIPMGSTIHQMADMKRCIKNRVARGECVTVYPEGHIWPYYTKIRSFADDSFMFPAADGKPVYTFTNCYTRGRLIKYPKVVTYVDGPFIAPEGTSPRAARRYLRDECLRVMRARAGQYSDYAFAEYIFDGDISEEGENEYDDKERSSI